MNIHIKGRITEDTDKNKLDTDEKWISTSDGQSNIFDVYINHSSKYAIINGYTVDYNTLCVGSGSKDKNGKEIFEGDVLKQTYLNPLTLNKEEVLYVTKFNNNRAFMADMIKGGKMITLLSFINESAEVVGNIHDNPELLEGVKSNV